MEPISLSRERMRGPILRLQSDERLARFAADGDERAFEALARRHRPTLQRACGRVLRGPQLEDATQRALLSAHQALRRNGPPDRFEPWLHRIAVNAALKELQAMPDHLPLDEERLDGVEQPAERVERRERLRHTVGAIGELPERQRRALVLRELEGRSHEEIARDLGLTKGAVRQLIHRARAGVRSAVTAVTPYGLLLRMGTDSEGSVRAAEIVAGGGTGAYVGKTLVAALVAGGIAGGVALAPKDRTPTADSAQLPAGAGAAAADGEGDGVGGGSGGRTGEEREREGERGDREDRREREGRDGEDDEARESADREPDESADSGRRDDDAGGDEDSSGSSGGDDDSSGSSGGDDDDADD